MKNKRNELAWSTTVQHYIKIVKSTVICTKASNDIRFTQEVLLKLMLYNHSYKCTNKKVKGRGEEKDVTKYKSTLLTTFMQQEVRKAVFEYKMMKRSGFTGWFK